VALPFEAAADGFTGGTLTFYGLASFCLCFRRSIALKPDDDAAKGKNLDWFNSKWSEYLALSAYLFLLWRKAIGCF